MANDLLIPGGDARLDLPAHLRAAYSEEDTNIITGDRGASLTVAGKIFTVSADGETTKLMRQDEEGNEYPLASLPVVILDYAVKTGRSYYDGAFDPNEVKPPVCWSSDSVTPDADVEEKQSLKCGTCPHAVKGSKLTDAGKATVECAIHRILAVVPVKAMDRIPPLRLRIAQTSNYDGRSPEAKAKNMFAFSNYLDHLKARKVPNTKVLVTSLSFDPNANYPKLFFKAVRYVSQEEHAQVEALMAGGKVGEILGETGTAAYKAVSGTTAPRIAAPAKAEAAAPAATKPAATVEDEDDKAIRLAGERKAARLKEAAEIAAKQAAAAQEAAKPKAGPVLGHTPVQGEDEDEDDFAIRLASYRKAQKAMLAQAPAAPAAFEAPPQGEDEDEDDYAIRVAGLRKAHKAKAGAPAAAAAPKAETEAPARKRRTKAEMEAAKAAEATPVPNGQERPAEKFLPAAAAMAVDMGGDDGDEDGMPPIAPTKAATKPAAAKVIEAAPVKVSDDVAKMLESWED